MTAIEKAPPALLPAEYEKQTIDWLRGQITPYLKPKKELYTAVAKLATETTITDADSLARADNLCKEALRELDGLEEVRKSLPFRRIADAMNADFKELRDPLAAAAAELKEKIGAHVVAERNKQSENYQAAASAHAAGDHGAAQVLLATASEAETATPKGTSVKEVWAVERFVPGLMLTSVDDPDFPGLVPNMPAINAHLRKTPITEHPSLPGVVCKKVPAVTSRR